jgi:hypothetical protein
MSVSSAYPGAGALQLQVIPREGPWEAFLLPRSLPMPDPEVPPVREFFQRLSAILQKERGLKPEVFIQFTELHQKDAGKRLAEHGREWIPGTGLGVWPDRPPPASWTQEQFEDLLPGESMPTLMYTLFQVTAAPEVRDRARDVMLGLGTVIQVLTEDETETFLNKSRGVLLPPITDPCFTCFPFYVPMFDVKSLRNATAAQLETWSCGASVYIRESYHDAGILIACRGPLAPVLEKLGARFRREPEPVWDIPTASPSVPA